MQLARGRRPACNCFGTGRSKPIGPLTLVRNGALLACAATVVAAGPGASGPSAVAWFDDPLRATIGALGLSRAAQVACSLPCSGATADLARLDELEAEEATGLGVGDPHPISSCPISTASSSTLADLPHRELPVLLLFSHPACGPCAALLPEIARWQREHDEELTVAVVSSGDLEDDRALSAEHGLPRVLRDDEDSVAQLYGSTGTPMALLVGADGLVAGELVVGATAIGALVSSVVDSTTREVLIGVQ